MESMDNYREMQTKFVSHFSGSPLWEVLVLIIGVPALSVLIRNLLLMLLGLNHRALIILVDFVCYIIPSLLACTYLSHNLIEMVLVMTIVSGVLMIGLLVTISNQIKQRKIILNQVMTEFLYRSFKGELTHVTSLRAYTIICTCICILAVDFVIYPRRFAKTETFGVSFMDIGVGAFIISNAIVSPEGRKMTENLSVKYKIKNFLKVVKGSSLIFVFGVIRLITVKGTNYQEHVTEYGLHWNFFFTLFFVKLASSFIMSILPMSLGIFPSQIISFCYEFALSNMGLMAYIISDAPRETFLDANREGIFSIAGYLSLYLLGVEIGKSLFSGDNRGTIIVMLFSLFVISIGIGACLYYHQFQISRRLANLSYVIVCVFITSLALLAFIAVDAIKFIFMSFFDAVSRPQDRSPVSKWSKKKRNNAKTEDKGHVDKCTKPFSNLSSFNLLNAVNDNGLAYFLAANLLTGLVNVSMQTVRADTRTGFLVVLAYSALLTAGFSGLAVCRVRIKFW